MTDPTPDQLTAYLEEVREAVGQRDELVARMRTAAVSAVEFNAAQDRLAEHVPRLLAAVEAVLALVDPPTTVMVTDFDGNWETVRRVVDCGKVREAISRALLGEVPDE